MDEFHRHISILAAALALLACIAAAGPPAPAAGGTLAIFLAAEDDFPSSDLRARLDGYRLLADELGIGLEVRTLDRGAPPEVVGTPLIIFQNHRGRSIYQGRYTNLERVRNFVRTAKLVPQSGAPLPRAELPVWETGRARIAAPIKLTALSGNSPDGFDADRFRAESLRDLAAGMERFAWRSRIDLRRADRTFYLDVHPYHADGLLFLSCEIYSQFNCHVPVYSALDDPLVGLWEDRAALFADAGAQLEAEVRRLMTAAPSPDAYTPAGASVPIVSWDDLGLALPEPDPATRAAAAATLDIPRNWIVDDAAPPTVLFRFAPPLDNYAGEARALTGEVRLGEDGLSGSAAVFRVPVASITMGEPLLDEDLQTARFLDGAAHPVSTFTMTALEAETPALAFGEQTRVTMQGRFELKGLAVPISVRGALEPVVGPDARPRLLLTADWSVRLADPFSIEGPEGPSPARDTVLFSCRITLRPKQAEEEQ